MIISALDKMYLSGPPRQLVQAPYNTLPPNDSHEYLAFYAFIRLLGDISSSIHTNSMSILDYVRRQSELGVVQSTKVAVGDQSTPAGPEPHPLVPDVRGGLTEFLVQTLDSLESDVKHHQDITEALTFKLTTSIASLVIAVDQNIVSKPEAARQLAKEKKRKVEPTPPIHQPPDPETQQQLIELAAEETSWFFLEILHCSLVKYSEILASRVHDDPTTTEDNILNVQDQGSRHGQHLVERARAKLRDIFLQGVSSPLPGKETASPEGSVPPMGTNMRLTSLPVVYEVWGMIGFEI